jgi:predicted TIM-barrel fold metal-dependent hydrolase
LTPSNPQGQSLVAIRAALGFFGPDLVLLGSDAPFASPADHLATLAGLRLAPDQYAQLLAGNARAVLRLSEPLLDSTLTPA